MRGVLETHFTCAECGSELELKYEKELEGKIPSTKCTDISGGYKVENRVFIMPCRSCMQPAKDIMRAVATLHKAKL